MLPLKNMIGGRMRFISMNKYDIETGIASCLAGQYPAITR